MAEVEPGDWRAMMASNLDSVYNMSRLVLPHMRRNHWGRIINVGAVGAERTDGLPNVAAFSAAKAGVIAFSKALALEEARCGITVNVVCPGVLTDGDDADTEMTLAAAARLGRARPDRAGPARWRTWSARSSSSPPPPPTSSPARSWPWPAAGACRKPQAAPYPIGPYPAAPRPPKLRAPKALRGARTECRRWLRRSSCP